MEKISPKISWYYPFKPLLHRKNKGSQCKHSIQYDFQFYFLHCIKLTFPFGEFCSISAGFAMQHVCALRRESCCNLQTKLETKLALLIFAKKVNNKRVAYGGIRTGSSRDSFHFLFRVQGLRKIYCMYCSCLFNVSLYSTLLNST